MHYANFVPFDFAVLVKNFGWNISRIHAADAQMAIYVADANMGEESR